MLIARNALSWLSRSADTMSGLRSLDLPKSSSHHAYRSIQFRPHHSYLHTLASALPLRMCIPSRRASESRKPRRSGDPDKTRISTGAFSSELALFRFFEIFSIYILHLAPRMAELIGHLKNVNRESNLYISERDNLVTFAPFDTDDSTVVSSQFFHNPRHIEYRT
jgi:hypothetical protein